LGNLTKILGGADFRGSNIEDLGNLVIDKVYQKYGIKLEWEVKIIGDEK
jgi:UDP-N-acetylenolpyruvoylglucosamine reductase